MKGDVSGLVSTGPSSTKTKSPSKPTTDSKPSASQQALDYLSTHDITHKLNVAVNLLVRERPDNPFGFLVTTISIRLTT